MMKASKKNNLKVLKVKKAFFFVFVLSFFFLPGSNYYLNLDNQPQPSLVKEIESELPSLNAYPVNLTNQDPPYLTAQSVLVLDRDSAVVLFQKNGRKRLLPASTVKIMTALISLEHYQLDESLIVSGINWEGQDIELQEGEVLSVRSLLYAT